MTTVVHLVSQLPPAICGVGDYATVVGRRMEELQPGVRCGFVAAGHRAGDVSDGTGRRMSLNGVRASRELWRAVEQVAAACNEGAGHDGSPAGNVAVVLHYSGYGYDVGGAPAWLAEAVEGRPAWVGRLATFFHELYATGRPWQRAFWTSGRQRAVAIRIARASDAVLTNREQSAQWLEKQAGLLAGSVPSLPVCSNVGEPEELVPWEQRSARAVTFGGAAYKRFALWEQAERVAKVLTTLGIEELVDIGASTRIATKTYHTHGIQVNELGRLPAAQISDLLMQTRIGLVCYPASVITKSGTIAAFAAHGVAIMTNIQIDHSGLPALALPTSLELTETDLRGCARICAARGFEWYRGHDVQVHATALADVISGSALQSA